MANQQPTRRPAFVTQRDGSALANSNCRMASISMGIDYHTGGDEQPDAAEMRSYTSDQSGGTDSGDAREAWDRGFSEALDVEDGKTFADAIASLRAGRLVHLDVWHAALNDGCISGSGAYGHTIAVIPDFNGEWSIGDPWCTDGYKRCPESKLKAGAEEWGRRVYGAARDESGGADPSPEIVRRIVKRLMSRSYPGNEQPIDDYPDTGGAQPILFTQTMARALKGSEVSKLDELLGAMDAIVQRDGQPYYNVPPGNDGHIQMGVLGNGIYHVRARWLDSNGKTWFLIDGADDTVMRWIKA